MISRSSIPSKIDLNEGEVVLLDKPRGMTSFGAIKRFREIYPQYVRKTGHAGTLDPMATGLLILCTGKKTRMIRDFQELDKEYEGSMKLGAETPSYDTETAESANYDTSALSNADLQRAAKSFTGTIDQVPPAYSAVWVGGKRSYDRVRQGEEVTLNSRQVIIRRFDLLNLAIPHVDFRVVCTKGTYIRSLVHDFGKVLNNGAYLKGLRRTAIGDYRVEDALTLEELEDVFRNAEIEKSSK